MQHLASDDSERGTRRWLELIVHPRDVNVAASCASPTRHAIASAVATHAVDLLQLRATPDDSDADVRSAARALQRILSDARPTTRCRLIVNHPSLDLTVALGGNCGGWHLKEHAMLALAQTHSLADVLHSARRSLGDNAVIGCSVHSVDSALAAMQAAENGFDYLQVGTMFSTPSHPEKRLAHQLEGPALIKAIREAATATRVPMLIGVGGINTVEHIEEVLKAEADGVAMIRGLLGAEDPAAAARAYRACLDG
ncbi:hypothetical protein PINS_up015000 [Pythium insidiosum]|nr:hypothetical protein PINS_up015000 [Pythium insidiosum]